MGLHHGEGGTIMHLLVSGVTLEEEWAYGRGARPLPVLWVHDSDGRWHATDLAGVNPWGNTGVTMVSMRIIPPLDRGTAWPTPQPTGGIPMNAANSALGARCRQVFDYTPFPYLRKGLRGSWFSPPRPGLQRLIPPWAYRHLRFYGVGHIAGGSIAAAAGVVCLSYGVYGWGAFFLILGALNIGGGSWYLTVDRSRSART